MARHTLIWRDGRDTPTGANGLTGWTQYLLAVHPPFFRKVREGQIGMLAPEAVAEATKTGTDITIGWGDRRLWSASTGELQEEALSKLQPAILICPERPGRLDRWVISTGAGTPASLPGAAIERAIPEQVAALYPTWRHGIAWNATSFRLRCQCSAEEFGIIAPARPTADDILNAVAMDEAVLSANRRDDLLGLAAARLAAQAALGVPEDERSVLYVGQIEDLLAVPLSRMPFDAAATVAMLRRRLRHEYGELSEIVLSSVLRGYPHPHHNLVLLREAAQATAAPAA